MRDHRTDVGVDRPRTESEESTAGAVAMSIVRRAASWLGTSRWPPAVLAGVWIVWSIVLGTGAKQRVLGLSSDTSEPVEHVVTFLILGALVMMVTRRRAVVVFVILVAAGLVGELIQLAIAGRTFSLADLGMDAIGAAVGIALARGAPPWARIATYALAISLVAVTPVALTDSETPPVTTFPEDCSPPPAANSREPEVVLGLDGLEADDLPRTIGQPSVAQIRRRLLVTNELTVETWFETSDLSQDGPARVLTISKGSATSLVNVHVGVTDDGISIRLRNSCDIFNWIQIDDVLTADRPHHVVFTWSAGRISTWVDGTRVSRVEVPWGDFDRWNGNYRTVIGGEFGGGRAFSGTIYSVTMWDGALSDEEIVRRAALVPG